MRTFPHPEIYTRRGPCASPRAGRDANGRFLSANGGPASGEKRGGDAARRWRWDEQEVRSTRKFAGSPWAGGRGTGSGADAYAFGPLGGARAAAAAAKVAVRSGGESKSGSQKVAVSSLPLFWREPTARGRFSTARRPRPTEKWQPESGGELTATFILAATFSWRRGGRKVAGRWPKSGGEAGRSRGPENRRGGRRVGAEGPKDGGGGTIRAGHLGFVHRFWRDRQVENASKFVKPQVDGLSPEPSTWPTPRKSMHKASAGGSRRSRGACGPRAPRVPGRPQPRHPA